ncbi:MAG TPA: acyl carrier protein [Allosphingosinicella sp.]|jgi:acyl carrier protein
MDGERGGIKERAGGEGAGGPALHCRPPLGPASGLCGPNDASAPEGSLHLEIAGYIHRTFVPLQPFEAVLEEGDLVARGILDSLSFIELVGGIENLFGIRVPEDDMIGENFNSVEAIVRYLDSRRAG